MMKIYERPQWSSYTNYLLVTIGAIVGLGNVFQFPHYVANFGGLFLITYVVCELLISLPILFAELLIGRRGKQNPVGAISLLAIENDASPRWRGIGWLCFVILFLTFSFYAVAVAFPIEYLIGLINLLLNSGSHADIAQAAPVGLQNRFYSLDISFLIFLAAVLFVIYRGINHGLEFISRIVVPLYFIILVGLAIYACTTGDFLGSVRALFHIDLQQNFLPILFSALTFAFFKLNVGMGTMIVYGSYLPYNVSLGKSTLIIIGVDAIISLLAYFIITPIMLPNGMPVAGTNQYHNTLLIFASNPYGFIVAPLFFIAAILTAWTVAIAMVESAAVILIERLNLSRAFVVLLLAIGFIISGTIIARSYNIWSHILIANWTFKDIIVDFASDFLTPISAFFIAIFAGWILKKSLTKSELMFNNIIYKIWLFLIRFVAPLALIAAGIILIFNL